MLGVVGEVSAGGGMGENGQAIAIERYRLREIAELLGERPSAGNCRAGAGRPGQVEMTDRHIEALSRRFAQGARPLQLLGVEVNVRVEILD